MYDKCDLRAQVPMYHQHNKEAWCGPTNIQMALNGCPNAAYNQCFTQVQLVNAVRPNNTNEGWDTDPQGLYKTLNQLKGQAPVNWGDIKSKDPNDLLLQMITAMDRTRYPVPTLVNGGNHWILMVQFESDVQPTPGATVIIQGIGVYDPLDEGDDIYHHLHPEEWFDSYWLNPNALPKGLAHGQWKNDYVAVVQKLPQAATLRGVKPAARQKRGKLVIPKPAKAAGARPISPASAQKLALAWFRASRYSKEGSHLGLADAPAGAPMLVRSLVGRKQAYFIVPIHESKDAESGAGVAVLIDAATGAFRQAALSAKPIRYLGHDQALAIVRSALGSRAGRGKGEAELVHRPCTLSQNRAWPFWRVRMNGKTYYVTQWGELFLKLEDPARGGN